MPSFGLLGVQRQRAELRVGDQHDLGPARDAEPVERLGDRPEQELPEPAEGAVIYGSDHIGGTTS